MLAFLASHNNDPGSKWATANGQWVFGISDPFAVLDALREHLTQARSVKAIVFDHASTGALHCQTGAPSLWQGALFDWLAQTFPGG